MVPANPFEEKERRMNELQQLSARADIGDLLAQYASGLDLVDREMFESCHTDPVDIDFGSFDSTCVKMMTAAEWADWCWDHIQGLDSTQHIMANYRVTFGGEAEATVIAYLQAVHYIRDVGAYTAGGYYTNRVVRTPGGWRFARVRFTLTWESGDRGIFDIGRQRPVATRVRPY
jgi:hypothetical protein